MILGHLDAALELKYKRLNSFKKLELCLNEGFIFWCKQFCKFIEKLAPSHVKITEIMSYIPIVCSSTFKMKSLDFLRKHTLCFGIEGMKFCHSSK
jgi:hypothetical protein